MNDLRELVMELEELLHKAKKMMKSQGMGQRNYNGSGYNGNGGSMGQRRNMGYHEDWDDWRGSNYDPRFMD